MSGCEPSSQSGGTCSSTARPTSWLTAPHEDVDLEGEGKGEGLALPLTKLFE